MPLEQLAWHSSQEWFDGGQEASGPGPPMGQVIGDRVLYRWDGNEKMRLRQKLLPGWKIEDGLIGLFLHLRR